MVELDASGALVGTDVLHDVEILVVDRLKLLEALLELLEMRVDVLVVRRWVHVDGCCWIG